MNIHLVEDEKFINKSIERFEYYYPNQNIFFVDVSKNSRKKMRMVSPQNNVISINFNSKKDIALLESFFDKLNVVFIHFLTGRKAIIVNNLKSKYRFRTFWIFYGSDLYITLYNQGKYSLYDNVSFFSRVKLTAYKFLYKNHLIPASIKAKERFIEDCDYFCFWNKFDYELLINSYETKAVHRYFSYYDFDLADLGFINKIKNGILINHASSRAGNHLTIFKKLQTFNLSLLDDIVYCPLSYGDSLYRKSVNKQGYKVFEKKFAPLLSYMPKHEYFKLLREIKVAIFGHKRQEGGTNIFFLLAQGAKIFLRKENNLWNYLNERGYYIFDFDEDLNSVDDLASLDVQKQNHNRNLILEEFSKENIDKTYKNLIETIDTPY